MRPMIFTLRQALFLTFDERNLLVFLTPRCLGVTARVSGGISFAIVEVTQANTVGEYVASTRN